MPQPPAGDDPPNVRRLSDKQPIGLVPGLEQDEEPEQAEVVPPDYPHILHALADSMTEDLATERLIRDQTIEELKRRLVEVAEQRDWAYVNRDTHYQRVLQLEAENAELRAQLDRR